MPDTAVVPEMRQKTETGPSFRSIKILQENLRCCNYNLERLARLYKARQITLKAQKSGRRGEDISKILKFGTFVHKRIIQNLYICL